MFARRRSRLFALPLFLLALGTAGCDVFGLGADDSVLSDQLRRAEQRWQQRAITSYEMTMQVARLNSEEAPLIRIVVENGQVVSRTNVQTGQVLTGSEAAGYLSIQGVFDLIREALGQRVPAIFVIYDEDYGFPTDLHIDYDQRRLSDDILILITDFSPAI